MKTLLTILAAFAAGTVACSADTEPGPTSETGKAPSTETSPAAPAPGPAPGSPAAPSNADACTEAGWAICTRACGCATDGKCHVAIPVGSGAYGAFNFDDFAHCEQWYVGLACMNGGKAGFDYPACTADVNASACVDAAGDLRGVAFPASCKVKN